MIHLHTGLPGAGKTLCTLVEVKQRAEKEKRPVFYSGIADLRLPWTELEKGEDWHTLPAGAIVVIDEAQRVFRPRHTASAVPAHVAKLETHRHLGIDLYLVTQHPKLLDSNVRRLVGVHVHFVRAFGANAVTRHQWGEVQDNPQSRDDSIRALVPYPKDAFTWYKSAEVHTHKRRFPKRIYFLLAVPVVLAGLVWVAVESMGRWFDGSRITGQVAPEVAKGGGVGVGARAAGVGVGGSVKNATEWLGVRQARVVGLPHTAPVYDAIVTPTVAPFPAMCISTADRCVCYTQQATRMPTSDELCRSIVAHGFFKDWREAEAAGEGARGGPNGHGGRGDLSVRAPSSFEAFKVPDPPPTSALLSGPGIR